jgi:hypothetical protein
MGSSPDRLPLLDAFRSPTEAFKIELLAIRPLFAESGFALAA